MPVSQSNKADAFAALHRRADPFVTANAFDGCSARMLASIGFEAIATSSWVHAAMLGKHDGAATHAEAMTHARIIVEATDLPVSADLEKGFGDAPEDVAATIRDAGAIGLVGGSIEDATGDLDKPIYDFDHAVRRVEAAVAALRELPLPFTLTARTENFVHGKTDLNDTIRRLQAFEAAGADVLMAPGLPSLEAVQTVCSSLTKPFSFMAGIPGASFTVAELSRVGVRRISLGPSLYTHAMTAAVDAAREIRAKGSFGYTERTSPLDKFDAFLAD